MKTEKWQPQGQQTSLNHHKGYNHQCKLYCQDTAHRFYNMCAGYACSWACMCVYQCVCVCHRGERAKRPLPCTQIITWFYNVAYLYSGQFPLGGSQNNNAGHFAPPSGRPFSALILSMDLSSFPR